MPGRVRVVTVRRRPQAGPARRHGRAAGPGRALAERASELAGPSDRGDCPVA